jgi:DNA-binding transcriptional LysR family regulator
MATLNVSKTAKAMNLSQPAVSHALKRLRQELSDDLLVRSSREMVATPFAAQLAPQVSHILSQLEEVLERKAFDPMKAEGVVHIQSTEYFEQLVLPRLLVQLANEAPGLKIINTSTRGQLPKAELSEGKCELAIAGFFGELPEGFYQQEIFRDRMVCLCAKDHSGAKGKKISLTDYLALKHVYISPEGRLSGGTVDDLLAKQKKKRNVIASIAGFGAPAWICTAKDFSCTLPEKLASQYIEQLPLKWFELPVDVPAIRVVQVWHERTQRDPLFRFVRSTIHKVCEEI